MRIRLVCILMIATLYLPEVSYSRTFGQMLCKSPGFFCLRVRGNESWQSLWPDDHERRLVMRINRMNTEIWGGMVIAVPNNLRASDDLMDYSPFPKQTTPPGEKLIIFDPRLHAFGAYDSSGILVRWGPASGGSDWCRDLNSQCHTNVGKFRVFSLGDEDCKSKKFPLPKGGAPMPYCMYFNNGQAFHGEPNGLPGFNASHGCVRLYVSDAEWMRFDFIEGPTATNKYRGTRVIVNPYPEVENSDNESSDGGD